MEKRRLSREYYLRLNDNDIIDLNYEIGPDSDDFLALCEFTSSFKSEKELGEYLKNEVLKDSNYEIKKIEVIKKYKDTNDNTKYKIKTESLRPLLKDDLRFFSERNIRNFFYFNRFEYAFMQNLLHIYESKISNDLSRYKFAVDKKEYLNSLRNQHNNIKRMLRLIEDLRDEVTTYETEYEERLEVFVESLILYKRKKTTKNYHGILELAILLSEITKYYNKIYIPKPPKEKAKSFLVYEGNYDESTEIDPDEYMVLTDKDFDRILEFDRPVSSESLSKMIESIEHQKEDLETLKRKHH